MAIGNTVYQHRYALFYWRQSPSTLSDTRLGRFVFTSIKPPKTMTIPDLLDFQQNVNHYLSHILILHQLRMHKYLKTFLEFLQMWSKFLPLAVSWHDYFPSCIIERRVELKTNLFGGKTGADKQPWTNACTGMGSQIEDGGGSLERTENKFTASIGRDCGHRSQLEGVFGSNTNHCVTLI